MDPAIVRQLVDLNQEFYEQVATEFSQSRQRLNDGIVRVLDALGPVDSVLDLGCGDARVGHHLRESAPRTHYVGVDRSPALLHARGTEIPLQLIEADLSAPGWARRLQAPGEGFDAVMSFSFLHHLPSREGRRAWLVEATRRLAKEGTMVISVWQLTHDDRLRRRCLSFSEIGLDDGELERGDLLLDWRRGKRALRYVHEYDEPELREDCTEAGLEVLDTFRSDGRSGDLGLYLVAHHRRPGEGRAGDAASGD